MLNAIVSRPGFPSESWIAWRSEPVPESFVFVTVNVVAARGTATAPTRIRANLFMGRLLLEIERLHHEHRHLSARAVGERAIVVAATAAGDVFGVELLDPVGEQRRAGHVGE